MLKEFQLTIAWLVVWLTVRVLPACNTVALPAATLAPVGNAAAGSAMDDPPANEAPLTNSAATAPAISFSMPVKNKPSCTEPTTKAD